jgi:hypothetical protein
LRYARKVDGNHAQLKADLRAKGYNVTDFSALGGGAADLYVSDGARGLWIEAKNPGARAGRKRGAAQAATDERQAAFRELHPNCVVVATSADEVAEAFRIL